LKTIDLFSQERLIEFFRSYQRTEIARAGLRRAAVLIPLVVQDSQVGVLFTVRTEDVEHHKGQISFPGGVADPGDATLIQTALRETDEETGIGSSHIIILGVCGDYSTPSGFNIAPVVGSIPHFFSISRIAAFRWKPTTDTDARSSGTSVAHMRFGVRRLRCLHGLLLMSRESPG
jgi:8-oxo-dGTP pyrophosphatase MutT (NUDIX family)